MALKALKLRKSIDLKKKELDALRAKDAEFQTREAELERSINEAETDEDMETINGEMEVFSAEKEAHEAAKADLEREVSELEKELADEERNQDTTPPAGKKSEEREGNKMTTVENRTRFYGMSLQERDAFFADEEIKTWLQRVREIAMSKRTITGSDLLIPEKVLPLIQSETERYSKLLKYVNEQNIPGTARQVILGDIPEGVWTEMCGKLNEVNLTFTEVEVDGYKVGAFIPVCNALLEDSDINLAAAIIDGLGQGLAYAIDKAIVYGTGTKMPTGFAATATAVTIASASATGMKLFQEIIRGTANLKHAVGEKFWVMNDTTKAKIMAESLAVNAAGAIVAGVNETMPIIGGKIETLDFVPDNEVLGGYGQRYLFAQRAGTQLKRSEEYRFVEDQTVFKATARADGKPVFANAFIAYGIGGAPTKTYASGKGFVVDTANAEETDGEG